MVPRIQCYVYVVGNISTHVFVLNDPLQLVLYFTNMFLLTILSYIHFLKPTAMGRFEIHQYPLSNLQTLPIKLELYKFGSQRSVRIIQKGDHATNVAEIENQNLDENLKQENEILIGLGRLYIELVQSVPKCTKMRRLLLQKVRDMFWKKIPLRKIAAVLHVPDNALTPLRLFTIGNLKTLFQNYHESRQRISPDTIKSIEMFWMDHCRASAVHTMVAKRSRRKGKHSTDFVAVYWQNRPTISIYNEFLKQDKIEKVSYTTFEEHRPYFVKPFIKHECCCPLCRNYFTGNNEHRARLQSRYDKHMDIYQDQFAYYKDQINNMPKNEAIILMDFGSGYVLPQKQYESSVEFFSKKIVRDLVVVLIFRNSDGQLKIQYFDFLSDTMKTTYPYVEKVWYYLFEMEFLQDFVKIQIFSDGGPHHFKTLNTIHLFEKLQNIYNKEMIYNLFASYHGKGLYDAHTGIAKRKIKCVSLSGYNVESLDDVLGILNEIKNTTAIELPADTEMPKVHYQKMYKQIKKFHQFSYPKDREGYIICKEKSTDTNFVEQKSFETAPPAELTSHTTVIHHCSECKEVGHNKATCPHLVPK